MFVFFIQWRFMFLSSPIKSFFATINISTTTIYRPRPKWPRHQYVLPHHALHITNPCLHKPDPTYEGSYAPHTYPEYGLLKMTTVSPAKFMILETPVGDRQGREGCYARCISRKSLFDTTCAVLIQEVR